MKFSFIIPTINHLDLLKNCVASIKRHEPNQEIIVVDDGSTIPERNNIYLFCKKEGITFLYNQINSGFSKSVNKGMKYSNNHPILINNDVVLLNQITPYLVSSFNSDSKIGVVGSLLLFPDNKIQHGGMQRAGSEFLHQDKNIPLTLAVQKNTIATKKRYVITTTGALYAIRRELINDIGYFDENYFLSCEETNYSLRTWNNGWKVLYNPMIKAMHIEGGTRGNTHHSKVKRSAYWVKKEQESRNTFFNFLKTINLDMIEKKVIESNIEKNYL